MGGNNCLNDHSHRVSQVAVIKARKLREEQGLDVEPQGVSISHPFLHALFSSPIC